MRYASIRSMDISNGEGIGVALFVQGCHFHCKNCFNQETWDFNGGYEWTEEVENDFLKLINKPHVNRVSFLGGEPLASENVITIHLLIEKVRQLYPDKKIWLWTGYNYDFVIDPDNINNNNKIRLDTIRMCDYIIDRQYVDDLRDLDLLWRGSSNQRVIDMQKTMQTGSVVKID